MASNSHQLRADYGMIDQASSDIASHGGDVDAIRAQLKSEAAKVVGNFGGGAGSEQHGQAMKIVDGLIDEYLTNNTNHKTATVNVNDTMRGAGSRMSGILGSGA